MANYDWDRLQDLMRRVISRRNETDSLSAGTELQSYLAEFVRDIMPQETKNFENFDIYDFSTASGDFIYTFNSSDTGTLLGGTGQDESGQQADGSDENVGDIFTNILGIAYSSDPTSSDTQLMNFYQDPVIFYDKWGLIEDDADAQIGRPTDILFYNNRFEMRPIPDGMYTISIPGFRNNPDYTSTTTSTDIPHNYWGRYIVYGASLDYMYDFGYDFNRIQVVEKRFNYYKALVHSRTFNQMNQENPIPRF